MIYYCIIFLLLKEFLDIARGRISGFGELALDSK
jgi:hypothetical protein